ncbi:MAG: hypothetical protein KAT37_04460 [Candidatus Aenigmarchaeota archaeon]|nr:hypothetical protein [Candidatus Aenigmarchaeota archaeon]
MVELPQDLMHHIDGMPLPENGSTPEIEILETIWNHKLTSPVIYLGEKSEEFMKIWDYYARELKERGLLKSHCVYNITREGKLHAIHANVTPEIHVPKGTEKEKFIYSIQQDIYKWELNEIR